eukprot:jgi/Hompol1/1212/HPOL_000327-RA
MLKKPNAPSSTDCCASGCVHCVWDLYEDDMEQYNADRRGLIQRLKELGVDSVEDSDVRDEDRVQMDPGLKALRDMERELKRKQESVQ